jgi:DNA-binding NtrC family response regulator
VFDDRPTARMLVAAQPVTERLHLVLVTRSGITTFLLPANGEVRVGRSPECEVRVDEEALSRQHASIRASAAGTEVVDLGSANGTSVDGRRLAAGEAAPVAPGSILAFASVSGTIQRSPATSRLRLLRSHEYFLARLDEECARAAATAGTFGVVSIRSSVAGTTLPEVLVRSFRPGDVVATYAPAEYEVLVPDIDRAALGDLTAAFVDEIRSAGVDVVVGVAVYPEDGRTPAALLDISRNGTPPPLGSRPRLAAPIGALERLRPMTERVAATDINVLVLGETGVGKELLATMVHDLSPRRSNPLVAVNCAALGDALFESELFGHERGAFTGAVAAKAGLLESADGGSVFLDEVGELTATSQAKLLRVIERKEVTRVGALRPKPIDVRFIAATNRDLEAECANGRFRQDLFFRLNGMTLVLPPLRDRLDEIEALATLFVSRISASTGRKTAPRIDGEAIAALKRHDWPGNVRELKNVIERAVVLCSEDVIRLRHLRADIVARASGDERAASSRPGASLTATARRPAFRPTSAPPAATPESGTPAVTGLARGFDGSEAERQKIEAALAACAGNQSQAARLLGVSRGTLVSRLEQYGFPRPRKPGG